MQRPSSASGLLQAQGKNGAKPRSLVVPRGTRQTKSSPALAAAFSLRRYAVEAKHITGERPSSAPAGDLKRIHTPLTGHKQALILPISSVDLIGGSGKYRQVKAEEEFRQRRLEEEEQRRQELLNQAEKKRRQINLADRKRQHQLEEERRWQEENEQKRLAQLEQDRIKKEQQDKVTEQKRKEDEERRSRMPTTCELCDGSGKCQDCMGKGSVFHLFLIAKVSPEDAVGGTDLEHGRKLQGCDRCGGCTHNMLGGIKEGTGLCPHCQGLGKIWPIIDAAQSPQKSKLITQG